MKLTEIPAKANQEEILTKEEVGFLLRRRQLDKLGLRAASAASYKNWIEDRRQTVLSEPAREKIAC